MRITPALLAATLLVVIGSLRADEGNGLGQAFLAPSPVIIGGAASGFSMAFGSPGVAGGTAVIVASDGLGPTPDPFFGSICLDLTSPNLGVSVQVLDGAGVGTTFVPLPNIPSLVNLPPLYVLCVVVDFSIGHPFLSLSKTIRFSPEVTRNFRQIGPMTTPRAMHTATSLNRGPMDHRTKVLLAGGGAGTLIAPAATDTTELFDPLTRTFSAGPVMSSERSLHRAVTLHDDRILLAGGARSNGTVTSSCDLYDPATNTITPTGSMNAPRAGHAMTLLPDGRVLVSGGISDYQNVPAALGTALMTAQNTLELYDPVTETWTMAPFVMDSKRTGHSQTLMPNGTVMIVSGMSGATSGVNGVPTYTPTCQRFTPGPISDSLTPLSNIPLARGFHGASLQSNGELMVTGGFSAGAFFGILEATASCLSYDGLSWLPRGALPIGLAAHTQISSRVDGQAIVMGGTTGTVSNLTAVATHGRHDGLNFIQGLDVGLNIGITNTPPIPRTNHAITQLFDGSYLVSGGADGVLFFSNAFIYVD